MSDFVLYGIALHFNEREFFYQSLDFNIIVVKGNNLVLSFNWLKQQVNTCKRYLTVLDESWSAHNLSNQISGRSCPTPSN